MRQLEILREHKLRPTDLTTLLLLRESGSYLTDLSKTGYITTSSAYHAVQRMLERGLIRKKRKHLKEVPGTAGAPKTQWLELTPAGKKILRDMDA